MEFEDIKIDIHLKPAEHELTSGRNFYWCIMICNDPLGDWIMTGYDGWAKSPQEAFEQGYETYQAKKDIIEG
jgi:hypothetical protein